ncbi:MAG: 5-formyltetrahydrofolate cyclo-ligase, partial [Oscillospiraceae bacterium]|nr:5-formyltetrahydrofolate cyclo-ligase [Oscillospiraceae bacterium]
TRAFVGYCIQMDKPVALPCDCEKDGSMSFALLDRPISELEDGVYGIPVPPSTAKRIQPRDGDIIIVPALCYDKDGFRLGHGGGYYDRYLFTHRIVSVGLCREAMIVDSVPREEHDIGTDIIITEKRIARPKQAPQIEK